MASILNIPSILDDTPAEQDLLDFIYYRDTLAKIITEPTTKTPLTIGVFGSWGSGKTSLMKMIKTVIDQESYHGYKTVWFNAWKYHKEENLWRAFILSVLDSIRKELNASVKTKPKSERVKLEEELNRLEESLYRTVEWEEVGKWTLDWFKALRGTTEGAAEIALAFVPGGAPLVKILKQAAKAISGEDEQAIADAFHREVRAQRREQLRSLDQFEREFQQLIEKQILQGGGKLLIFIDDLDRCLAHKTIEVLESIKLFLDVPGCIFVLGLDHEATIEAVQFRYKERIKSRQYLEKMIQLPFSLPPIEVDKMRDFVNSIALNLPDSRCSEVFSEGLLPNPRQVKRTINIFLLLWELSRQKLPDTIHPIRLAKIVTLQQSDPELYRLLTEVPGLIRDLEQYFQGEVAQQSNVFITRSVVSLPDQLHEFTGRSNLRRLFSIHSSDIPYANFSDLRPEDIRPYIYLTRRTEAQISGPLLSSAFEPVLITVPTSSFILGTESYENEKPPHMVTIEGFKIGRYPVTNYEYSFFVRETAYLAPLHWRGNSYPEELGGHPVVYISWLDALAYCSWLSEKAGKIYRLPTEAEWELAARGKEHRTWPWGDDWDSNRCNTAQRINGTTLVGQFSPQGDSTYGLADVAGNIWEWCSTRYLRYPYHTSDGREDMHHRGERVLRGGSFISNPQEVRCSFRHGRLPDSKDQATGFRIVLSDLSEE